MKKWHRSQQGFTLPELIVIMAVFAVLVSLSSISLLGTQRNTSLGTTADTLIADLKHQQIKSMTGNTEGGSSSSSYGIYFTNTTYTLFKGTTYSAGAATNYVVTLPGDIEFLSNTLPSGAIVFQQGNGTFLNYASNQNSIVIKNINGPEQKTIYFNSLGVINAVN